MCFSAAASFATATATGAVGIATMSRARSWNEAPLAAIPLLFAAQQAIEGTLWLSLTGGTVPASEAALATAFAIFALVIWPIYAPVAIGLLEQQKLRRVAIFALAALGAITALYGVNETLEFPYRACITGHSLSYLNGRLYPNALMAAYVAATCLPALVSSHRSLWLFGGLVAIGLAVSTAFYFAQLFSVWCFFAAAASVAIAVFFARRQTAGAAISAS